MQTVWMRWLVRQGSSSHTHTHTQKKLCCWHLCLLSANSTAQHSYTFTSNLRYCNTTPTNFHSPQNKSTGLTWWRRSRTLVNRWQAQRSAWVQDNFTTYWLKCLWKTSQLLSTRDLTCTKRHHRVSLVVKVTVDRSSSRCGMHATKTLELIKKSWSSSFDLVLLLQSLRAADILNFRMRALLKRPRRSSKNQTRPGHSRGVVGGVRIRSGRNAVARSTWNFSGGFPVPALMVENRFQALPETSNRRFSSAEISGTGLICDWQNFWEKKNSYTGIMQCGRSEKETKTFHERPHMFQKGPICFRKDLYVSKEPHMLKKRPICCPYVVVSEGFSSPYVEKAPYVAKPVPICGPYAAHMWPICFGCSSVFLLWMLPRQNIKCVIAANVSLH